MEKKRMFSVSIVVPCFRVPDPTYRELEQGLCLSPQGLELVRGVSGPRASASRVT